jgi:hypothetical protein
VGIPGSTYAQKTKKSDLGIDVRIDRGLVFANHPLSHLISLQSWEVEGLPDQRRITEIEKLKVAERELMSVLPAWSKQKSSYSLGQVFSFLGFVRCKLASKYLRDSEIKKSAGLTKLADLYFAKAEDSYRKAVDTATSDLKYTFASTLVECAVSSGNLRKALLIIRELEDANVSPPQGEDFRIIRLKADIFWTMGRILDSALAYEKWIAKGGDDAFSPTSLIYQRLIYLKRNTGHPENFSY